jgi:SAM-dependent methyltransferase
VIRELIRSRQIEPCYNARVRSIARHVLPALYAGQTVGCPCCGGTFRRFIRRYAHDGLCPQCLSLRRHRSFWLFLEERLLAMAGAELAILHIAPEEGISERLRSRAATRYVTADVDPGSIAEMVFDIMAIPFPDQSFDIALCNHVFEHVQDDRVAMRELFRVLRPNGFLYSHHPINFKVERTVEDVTVTDPAERMRLFGQRDHVRRYGRDFVDRLEEAGFQVEVARYRPEPKSVAFYGLREEEPIFVCRRTAEDSVRKSTKRT